MPDDIDSAVVFVDSGNLARLTLKKRNQVRVLTPELIAGFLRDRARLAKEAPVLSAREIVLLTDLVRRIELVE